jgi:hypothetical protein
MVEEYPSTASDLQAVKNILKHPYIFMSSHLRILASSHLHIPTFHILQTICMTSLNKKHRHLYRSFTWIHLSFYLYHKYFTQTQKSIILSITNILRLYQSTHLLLCKLLLVNNALYLNTISLSLNLSRDWLSALLQQRFDTKRLHPGLTTILASKSTSVTKRYPFHYL